MRAWAVPLVVIPLIDQGVKLLLRRRLGARSVTIGPLASVRLVDARVWLARGGGQPTVARIWLVWALAASALAVTAIVIPASGVFVGCLLGGSLSHAAETTSRGTVCDYICPRWWPAFNLADVAITSGALGVLTHVSIALRLAWT